MRRLTRWIVATILAAAATYGAACTTSPDGAPQSEPDPSLADIVLEGDATFAAAGSMLAATPMSHTVIGPRIVAPPNDTVALASDVITFSWQPGGATALRLLPPDRPRAPAWLTELLGPERAAAAATAAPLTGRAYLLVFATAENPRLLRVLTTKTSYTPDAKAWSTLVGAGMWTSLTVVSADFVEDALLPGSGPYVGAPIELCIEGA